MKTIYIIGIILILVIILFYKKETFKTGDYIITNFPEDLNNNDAYDNVLIKKDFKISTELNVSNILNSNITDSTNLTLVDTDLRVYLTGMSIYDVNNFNEMQNSFTKRDYPVGAYNGGVNGIFYDLALLNIIVVYPGFGVILYNNYFNRIDDNACKIYNYGTKPLRLKLERGTPVTVFASASENIYNLESNTYYIENGINFNKIIGSGYAPSNFIAAFRVFLLDLNEWKNHSPLV